MLQGAYQGVPDVQKAWKPLQWKMTGLPVKQRQDLSEEDCKIFGEKILRLLRDYPNWGGSMVSTALHRFAQYFGRNTVSFASMEAHPSFRIFICEHFLAQVTSFSQKCLHGVWRVQCFTKTESTSNPVKSLSLTIFQPEMPHSSHIAQ